MYLKPLYLIYLKKSAYLLSVLLLVACQPPTSTDGTTALETTESTEAPPLISNDSVTMTRDYILNIKPSRYQPSLGLQGTIKPIKQTQFTALHNLVVEKVLVEQGQWVEKGTALLVVRYLTMTDPQEKNAKDFEHTTTKDVSALKRDNQALNSLAADSTDKAVTPKQPEYDDTNIANKHDSNTVDNNIAITPNRDSVTPKETSQLITVHASFSGRVDYLNTKAGQQIPARTPLLRLGNDKDLRFIAILPLQAEPQLSVGQNVSFTAEGLSDSFTGQVSHLMASAESEQLQVYVHVINNEVSRGKVLPNMLVTGRVNYGQIEVGTIVPENALHDVDLTAIQQPPYQSLMPLTANVWTIKQDQRLTRQPVEVISYDPTSKQYLIAGISNDSLICLADLPIESAGKKVVIS